MKTKNNPDVDDRSFFVYSAQQKNLQQRQKFILYCTKISCFSAGWVEIWSHTFIAASILLSLE